MGMTRGGCRAEHGHQDLAATQPLRPALPASLRAEAPCERDDAARPLQRGQHGHAEEEELGGGGGECGRRRHAEVSEHGAEDPAAAASDAAACSR